MDIEAGSTELEERLLDKFDSLGAVLEQLSGRMPPALLGGRGWDGLLECARGLPVSLGTRGFGLEMPLHEPEPKADLGTALYEGSRSAAHFSDWCRSQPAGSLRTDVPRLLGEIGRERSALRRILDHKLMLIYDVDPDRRGAPPTPGVFVYAEDTLPGDGSAGRLEDLRVVLDALTAAGGLEPDAAERRQVERLFRAMPPDTRIGMLGVYPSRSRTLRVHVMGFRKTRDKTHGLAAFLERIEWPEPPAETVAFLSELEERGAFEHFGLNFNIEAGSISPELGVSCYAGEATWVKDAKPWLALIDSLRERNLAVPEKLSALADSWCGAQMMFGRLGLLLVVCGMHHVKLVLAGGRCEQAKAYVFTALLSHQQVASLLSNAPAGARGAS